MLKTRIAIAGSLVASLVLLAAVPAEARYRRHYPRPVEEYPWNPSVGRNAVPAIAYGLGDMAGGWIDTMSNAWAYPHFRDADYFDYYRRPYSASARRYRE